MADPRRLFPDFTESALDRELTRLSEKIAFPATPEIASIVRARIAEPPTPISIAPGRSEPGWWRRVAAIAAVFLLALVAVLTLFSGVRDTVADWFGVRGIRIVIERDETPTPVAATPAPSATPSSAGERLLLGQRTTIEAIAALAPFRALAPTLPSLGEPDEVYARRLAQGNLLVSYVYLADASLPEAAATGIGVLLMQFEARDDLTYITKGVGYEEPPVRVEIGPGKRLGWWIVGAHDLILSVDPTLGCCLERPRTAGSVLLWEVDGVTLRLESALSMEEAIAIAESMEPLSAPTPEAGTESS